MDSKKIDLVEQSFAKVAPIAETAAELFYARLFELDPSLKSMFKHDLKEQGRKLMASITMVVKGLRKPETIVGPVQQLGVRHLNYGVKEEHYATVGQALLDTLEKGLGDDFTPEVRSAWEEAYSLLSSVMMDAAYRKIA